MFCFCNKRTNCLIDLNNLIEVNVCKNKKCKFFISEKIYRKDIFVISNKKYKIISAHGNIIQKLFIDYYGNQFMVDINKPVKYNPCTGIMIEKIYDGTYDSNTSEKWKDYYELVNSK